MTIGDVIKKYREDHDISQRQFAVKCGISNGYISMLERDINPKTKEPIKPSLTALKAIASAMNISLNDLLIQADDMQIDLSDTTLSTKKNHTPINNDENERVIEFVELFRQLTTEQQHLIISQIKGILSNQ